MHVSWIAFQWLHTGAEYNVGLSQSSIVILTRLYCFGELPGLLPFPRRSALSLLRRVVVVTPVPLYSAHF
jgi:hypothetical protein